MNVKKVLFKVEKVAKLERLLALICISIPLLLRFGDNNNPFRDSISDYVYMCKSYIFGMLLSIAAMLFIFNGVRELKRGRYDDGRIRHGKWYNIILGISLFGVGLFPHLEYVFIHYFFAVLFFMGSAIVIALFNDRRHRVISVIIALISMISLVIHFIDGRIISLFWAEWISLIVIAIHFILESKQILTR